MRTAERVWEMVVGFAGFGFPKSHSAAFGLLAYQSTWLRVHYGPEFLCALLNEQPMGFYAPDSLVHEASHRGIPVLPADVNASEQQCAVRDGAVRMGLGYIKDVHAAEVGELVAERVPRTARSRAWRISRAGGGGPQDARAARLGGGMRQPRRRPAGAGLRSGSSGWPRPPAPPRGTCRAGR